MSPVETFTMTDHRFTRRNRFAVRWTTDPACVGYADTPDKAREAIVAYLQSRPDFIGTPRTVAGYMRDVKRRIGTATFMRFDFTACATGQPVHADVLRDLNAF
jgi:hypothetical protein